MVKEIKEPQRIEVNYWKAVWSSLGVMLVISLALNGYTVNTVSGLSGKIEQLQVEHADMRVEMALLPKESPPIWFAAKVTELEIEMKELQDKVEIRLDALEQR